MKLGIDIDGTIHQTHSVALELFNQELQDSVTPEQVTEFSFADAYQLAPADEAEIWRRLEEKIYSQGSPFEGAAQVLQNCVAKGDEVYYITARSDRAAIREITSQWLQDNGFPFQGQQLYMDAKDKGALAKQLGIQLFFEDAPHHIDRLKEQQIPIVIVDAIYNQQYTKESRMTNWQEAVSFIDLIR